MYTPAPSMIAELPVIVQLAMTTGSLAEPLCCT